MLSLVKRIVLHIGTKVDARLVILCTIHVRTGGLRQKKNVFTSA